VYTFFGQYAEVAYGQLAAFSMLYALPAVLLYLVVARRLSGAFTLGGASRADHAPTLIAGASSRTERHSTNTQISESSSIVLPPIRVDRCTVVSQVSSLLAPRSCQDNLIERKLDEPY